LDVGLWLCDKFLVDNGGEFANEELISLAEQFGITIKTTAGESPWSNGIVERHNLTLYNMLDRVFNQTNCSFNTGLYWCVNAKNSLYNSYGFAPYQLSIGTNPRLPSLMDHKPPVLSDKPATQMKIYEFYTRREKHSSKVSVPKGFVKRWLIISGLQAKSNISQVTKSTTRERKATNGRDLVMY